ncbi:hypothetical protein GWI33_003829 [Rhynchophorus ferrugineus]|uniref:Uncharacterized protein n=1 Tax=Rhynchophorus ferrugineus TaxID=354439 RepID=A0A834IQP9_RHYFE|nr:hypothetical protein GWI33_003829 [Rhynchophorus ferrugineus]
MSLRVRDSISELEREITHWPVAGRDSGGATADENGKGRDGEEIGLNGRARVIFSWGRKMFCGFERPSGHSDNG